MTDNLQSIEKHDDLRINMKKKYEVNYWTNNFAISESKLREAVKKVGPIVKDLRRFFQNDFS